MIELGVTPTLIQPVILCGDSRLLVERTAERCRALHCAVEPMAICSERHRSTAPALTLAAVQAVTADDPVLLVMPSDNAIAGGEAFAQAVERAVALAGQGPIAAFGVPPSMSETRYGCIRIDGLAGKGTPDAHYIEAFVEKPEAARAASYLESGQYLWNAGIYAVRASVWIDTIGSVCKTMLAACERAFREGRRDGGFLAMGAEALADCPWVSIDYAIMERMAANSDSLQAVVVRLDGACSDGNAPCSR